MSPSRDFLPGRAAPIGLTGALTRHWMNCRIVEGAELLRERWGMILQAAHQTICRYPEQLCPNLCIRCADDHACGEQLWFEWSGDIRGERLAGRIAAIQFIRERLAKAPLEYLFALYLDDHLRLVDITCVGRGSIDGVTVPIAGIIRRGFTVEAACFLLIHNHPSGDPKPSPQDVRITSRICYISREMDMPLVDHLIVASHGISSVGQW